MGLCNAEILDQNKRLSKRIDTLAKRFYSI